MKKLSRSHASCYCMSYHGGNQARAQLGLVGVWGTRGSGKKIWQGNWIRRGSERFNLTLVATSALSTQVWSAPVIWAATGGQSWLLFSWAKLRIDSLIIIIKIIIIVMIIISHMGGNWWTTAGQTWYLLRSSAYIFVSLSKDWGLILGTSWSSYSSTSWSCSYLQGKSFSLMQSAMQFSRLGTLPRFFAYWKTIIIIIIQEIDWEIIRNFCN